MASQDWLKLGAEELWIKCIFRVDSYSLWLTDLCQLYVEELDSDNLRSRTAKSKLPIDVDEAQNISTLLKNLSKSVYDGKLKVSPSTNKSRYMDLHATVQLPSPLPDIDWTFKLELQPDDRFRESVSRPLLVRINALQQQEEDLIHRLHDKDHVIDKLLDTLETHRVDLAGIFPSLASHGTAHRSNSRRDAEAHIPALQAFDEKAWQSNIARGKSYESTRLVEPSEQSAAIEQQVAKKPDIANSTSKAIRRTLGGRKVPTEASVTPEADKSELHAPVVIQPPLTQRPKGIKRTLGGHKVVETAESSTVTDAPIPENKSNSAEKPRDIKRTLDNRTADAAVQDSTHSHSPKATSAWNEQTLQSTGKEQGNNVDGPINEDELADRKRETLKQQFAAAAVHKPKKRRF